MKKTIHKYLLIFLFSLLFLLNGYANNPAEKQPYKPPILTTTAIIEIYQGNQFQGIVLIDRGKEPFGKAIPGGKVEYGETVENAVRREMMEEVNLELSELKQFHVYSEPGRDFRHHSVEVTHIAKAFRFPTPGDDALKAFVFKLEDIPWNKLAFDHAQILKDYIDWKKGNESLSIIKH